ncbi:hypothetical protein CSQ85_00125 [Bifidobacterium rousetti]|nr:hypothetical protein CSQ85_00125 [Bifidobacterium rousetti]
MDGQGSSEWNVSFNRRFSNPPAVTVGSDQARLVVHVKNISSTGFSVQGYVAHTSPRSGQIFWYAFGV